MNKYAERLKRKVDKYLRNNMERITEKHPQVTGAYFFWKHVDGKKTRRYAIVFQVEKKSIEIPANEKLPESIRLKVGSEKWKTFLTDVEESGKTELCSFTPGCTVYNINSNGNQGRCGVIAYKTVVQEKVYYLISNMHVLGSKYLNDPVYSNNGECRVSIDGNSLDISRLYFQPYAVFEKGIFNSRLDVAIARIPESSNALPKIMDMYSPIEMSHNDPWPNYNYPLEVSVYRGNSTNVPKGKIKKDNISISFPSPVNGYSRITFYGILKIENFRCNKGDSGSPVFYLENSRSKILAIILGRDKDSSYALPIMTILKTFKLNL